MKIDSYSFGRIVIDGKVYDDDVIITPQGVRGDWWRVKGHEFSLFDLAVAFEAEPKRLILGTGAAGACRVLPEVVNYCRTEGIELIIKPTAEAVVEYNSLEDKGTAVAALHLAC